MNYVIKLRNFGGKSYAYYYTGWHLERDFADAHKTQRVLNRSTDLAMAMVFADRLEAEEEVHEILPYHGHKIDCVTDGEIKRAKIAKFKRELVG